MGQVVQSVSTKFLATSRSSAKVVVTADLYLATTLIAENLPVAQLSIDQDLESDVTRSASLSIINPAATFSGSVDPRLDLLRCEVNIKAGYKYSSQQTELVSLGRFIAWSIDQDFAEGDQVLDMECYDRAKYMEIASIAKPYDFSGMSAIAAIQLLIDRSMPYTLSLTTSGVTDLALPGGSVYDTNHLEAAASIADSIGGKFIFDASGNPKVIVKPSINTSTPMTSAVFEFDCGDNGNIIKLSKSRTREGVYNGVAVYGAANENGVQPYGEAFDLNPDSFTYWNGSFGKALKKIDRPELFTPGDCVNAANSELAASTGGVVPVTMQVLPNMASEIGDIISVSFPDLTTTELHIIKSIDFDLDEMSMNIVTKGRSSASG